MDYNLVFFKKENDPAIRYELVKKFCINQVFFLTLLTIHHKDINCNYDIS